MSKGIANIRKKCRYRQPFEICKPHLDVEKLKCKDKGCKGRHPKVCKWFQRDIGCTHINCEYLHFILAKTENESKHLMIIKVLVSRTFGKTRTVL